MNQEALPVRSFCPQDEGQRCNSGSILQHDLRLGSLGGSSGPLGERGACLAGVSASTGCGDHGDGGMAR